MILDNAIHENMGVFSGEWHRSFEQLSLFQPPKESCFGLIKGIHGRSFTLMIFAVSCFEELIEDIDRVLADDHNGHQVGINMFRCVHVIGHMAREFLFLESFLIILFYTPLVTTTHEVKACYRQSSLPSKKTT